MALPTRGQADWDDEMASHIGGLEAQVAAADARSVVASSDATYARNRADEVHTAVIGTADAAIAALIEDEGSDTYAALDAGGFGGGSGSLTVVSGGSVDLPNAEPNGYLIGYRVTATTTIEGVSFAPGSYVFERDSTVGPGWTYRTLEGAAPVITLVSATPGTPTADDAANTYTIPSTTGVVYQVAGATKAAGAHPVGNINATVVVTAIAAPGYVLTDPALAGKSDWSWTFIFTLTPVYTTIIHDTFAGTDGAAIVGRTPDTVASSTTWSRTDATAATLAISSNRLNAATASGGPEAIIQPTPTLTTPATPSAVRVTIDYNGTNGHNETYINYTSTRFGSAQVIRYRFSGGVITANGTGLDNGDAALSAVPGQVLSGYTQPGTMVVEVIGNTVKVFIGGVHIANGALPGTLRAQVGTFSVLTFNNRYIDSYKLEVAS